MKYNTSITVHIKEMKCLKLYVKNGPMKIKENSAIFILLIFSITETFFLDIEQNFSSIVKDYPIIFKVVTF